MSGRASVRTLHESLMEVEIFNSGLHGPPDRLADHIDCLSNSRLYYLILNIKAPNDFNRPSRGLNRFNIRLTNDL